LAYTLNDNSFRIGDPPMNALLDGPEANLQNALNDASNRFRSEFKIVSDIGPGTIDRLDFPSADEVTKWRDTMKPRLPVIIPIVVTGHLPTGARTISFRFPEVVGMIVVTSEIPYVEPISEPVEAGEFSTPVSIAEGPVPGNSAANRAGGASSTPFMSAASAAVLAPPLKSAGSAKSPRMAPSAPPLSPTVSAPPSGAAEKAASGIPLGPYDVPTIGGAPKATNAANSPVVAGQNRAAEANVPASSPQIAYETALTRQPSWETVMYRYLKMGFHHIVPDGIDHILFVSGLFLFSRKIKSLLVQVTAFTIAHSLTLALSLYGVFRLPPSVVEPMIALSIAFVAIENIFSSELKWWRPLVVFGFGLVHGLGFASALLDLGLQRKDFLRALVGFNCGVECGQLFVVLILLILFGMWRNAANYRKYVVIPGSALIAVIAVFWVVQRLILYYG